jgi:hypothetical protein
MSHHTNQQRLWVRVRMMEIIGMTTKMHRRRVVPVVPSLPSGSSGDTSRQRQTLQVIAKMELLQLQG